MLWLLLIILAIPFIAYYWISYLEYDVEQDSRILEVLYFLVLPLAIAGIVGFILLEDPKEDEELLNSWVRRKYADVDFTLASDVNSSGMQG